MQDSSRPTIKQELLNQKATDALKKLLAHYQIILKLQQTNKKYSIILQEASP